MFFYIGIFFCRTHVNKCSQEEKDNILDVFTKSVRKCHILLGQNAFNKPGVKSLNRAIFLGWSVNLAKINVSVDKLKDKCEDARNLFKAACSNNVNYYNAITSSTGSKKNILLQLSVIRDIIIQLFGEDFL